MEKINKEHHLAQSQDIINDNISKLKELFPQVIAEGKIDFAVLQEILGQELETNEEYYRFTWAGKTNARREAHKPSTGTLRPAPADSVAWDSTQNLYLEGDNLEVLKLLQKSYANKVKMIYIDPPYNTGKDFVYKDNYKDNLRNYQQLTGQIDGDGHRLSTNSDTDGRYHSNWCNMIYPRLILARNLLQDDGVMFMSIDDNEVENLKKIGNEVFGEENFVAEIVREAIRGGSQSKNIRMSHDYVICFAKNIDMVSFTGQEVDGFILNMEDEKGSYMKGRELNKWGAGSRREDSPSMYFPIKGPNGVEVFPIRNDGSDGRWRLGKDKMYKKVDSEDVIFEARKDGGYTVYEKIRDNSARIKQFTTLFIKNYTNSKGTETIKKTFLKERSYFDYVKPIELMYDLMLMAAPQDSDMVLDFFSGSSSSAHSVIKYNQDTDSNIKFIMVQLPEPTAPTSEAHKAGYKAITEIGKERIRRAGKKIVEELQVQLAALKAKNSLLVEDAAAIETLQQRITTLDIGFKVFKLDSSNIHAWDGSTENIAQNLFASVDNIKLDRTPEDVLYEILLKYGLDLNLPIATKTITGKDVYCIGGGALFICLGKNITSAIATGIGEWKQELAPETCRVVFQDTGFTDVEKTNSVQILKRFGVNEIKSI